MGSGGDEGEEREKQPVQPSHFLPGDDEAPLQAKAPAEGPGPIFRILQVLKKHRGPFSQRGLASSARVSPTTAGNCLKGLEMIGLVERVEIEKKGKKKTMWVSKLLPSSLQLETLKSMVKEAIEKGGIHLDSRDASDPAEPYVLRVKQLYYKHGLKPPDEGVIRDFVRIKLAEAERGWPLRT